MKHDTYRLKAREEFERMKKQENYCFSSALNETATLDDLNGDYIREYLAKTGTHKDLLALSKTELARSMKLIGENEYGESRAKNFAVLMFADRPAEYIPYAYLEMI